MTFWVWYGNVYFDAYESVVYFCELQETRVLISEEQGELVCSQQKVQVGMCTH